MTFALSFMACGDGAPRSTDSGGPDAGAPTGEAGPDGGRPDGGGGAFCHADSECTPAQGAAPCAVTFCDRVFLRCTTTGPDADADGHADATCDPGVGPGALRGDDCDDADPARFPGRPELCDELGHDEDCDSTTVASAEGDVDGDGAFAAACCNRDDATGEVLCGSDCDDTDATVNASASDGPDVACDGRDNDCDLERDEGCACRDGQTRACGTDVGACVPGIETCGRGAWGECTGGLGPTTEECNGIDDECNGVIDDGCSCVDGTSQPCGDDTGECRAGVQRCEGGTWSSICEGAVGPEPEACDGDDDDCNGILDDGCDCTDGTVRPCGTEVGECVAGQERCNAGRWGACTGAVGPTVEDCDGGDEDCNGVDDNGCSCINGMTRPCPPPATDVGECVAGTQTCVGGMWGACAGNVGPAIEVCDGTRDENCDGNMDEGCGCTNGMTRPCPPPATDVGECVAGTQTCTAGTWGACTGGVGPMPEVCEGSHDEDCNGVVDNGCACTSGITRPCGAGSVVGGASRCVRGTETCSASGTWSGSCVGAIEPIAEQCGNAVDDDCDGSVNEGCGIVQLAAGYAHTCARRMSGEVVCWGNNGYGQLGDGTTTNRSRPAAVMTLTDAVWLTAGFGHSCAVRAAGSVVCWGANNVGQLGDGTLFQRTLPTPVATISDVVEVRAGYLHTCARRADGTVMCWGENARGQLGIGSRASPQVRPVATLDLSGAVQLTAGGYHSCARRSPSDLLCWGWNNDYQLGNGTFADALRPTASLEPAGTPILDAFLVAGGYVSSCAVHTGSVIRCAGPGELLGDGVDSAYPRAVVGLPTGADVAVGNLFACMRRSTNAIHCWGVNTSGQAGNGGTSALVSPSPTPILTDGVEVTAGDAHACARRTSGQIVCWGSNTSGQSGTGSMVSPLTTPAAVVDL